MPLGQRAHHCPVETINQARSLIGNQRHVTGLPWLEADSRSRRNVQATAKSSPPIERESRICLGKMIMAADLDRSVARVGNSERYGRSALVQDDLADGWKNFARVHEWHSALRAP